MEKIILLVSSTVLKMYNSMFLYISPGGKIGVQYSTSNLERPLLWFVANGYVFCCQMIIITAARLKLGRDVPPSFFSIIF